jgi:uncharacterized protein (DUF1015 family)
VPDFLPFAGIRYDADRLGDGVGDVSAVAAPPYDVIDEHRHAALESAHAYNSVRLILPRDQPGRDRYRVAAQTLSSWIGEHVLVTDPSPRLYVYEMAFTDDDGVDRHTRGVIGALALPAHDAHAAQEVLPHERTMERTRSDRLALLRATRANLDPIWCLSLARGLTSRLGSGASPLAACVDDDGVAHRLSAIDDPDRRALLSAAIGSAPIVIADGHHRFETACAYRDERPGDTGAAAIMALVVELTEHELCVRAIHRVLTGLDGRDLRSALELSFVLHPAGSTTPEDVAALCARMRVEGGIGVVDGTGLALLVPRPEAVSPALRGYDPAVRGVDATVFDAVVRPIIGGADVGYLNGAAAVAALVEAGAADAAVLLRPVTVAQIRAAAFAGVRMPEKTTFFYPKPRTGMVFRSLDG